MGAALSEAKGKGDVGGTLQERTKRRQHLGWEERKKERKKESRKEIGRERKEKK